MNGGWGGGGLKSQIVGKQLLHVVQQSEDEAATTGPNFPHQKSDASLSRYGISQAHRPGSSEPGGGVIKDQRILLPGGKTYLPSDFTSSSYQSALEQDN